MKRFYCSVCKRVRRAHSLPRVISTPLAEKTTDRVGQCNYHASGGPKVPKVTPKVKPVKSVVIKQQISRKRAS